MEIAGWADFNPRKNSKKPSWFRLDHDMLESPEFSDFSHGELVAWIYILSQASKKSNGQVVVFLDHAHRVRGLCDDDFLDAIEKLEELGHLKVSKRNFEKLEVSEVAEHATLHHITSQNITIQNPCSTVVERAATFDIEAIYRSYPRKQGKSVGMKKLKAQIKTQADYDDCLRAMANYKKSETVAKGFVMLFSTWTNQWRDCLDSDYGKTHTPAANGPSAHDVARREAERAKRDSEIDASAVDCPKDFKASIPSLFRAMPKGGEQ